MTEVYILAKIPFTRIEEQEEDYIKIKIEGNEIHCGDRYHRLEELYNHRHALYIALVKIYDNYITPLQTRVKCWKSKLHSDGTMFEGWFILGMTITEFTSEAKQISYHLPMSYWDRTNVIELNRAPVWDGHKSEDVIERLLAL